MHADWIDLFKLLNKHGVRYLVIGGNAVAYHGFERLTKDIDIWLSPDKKNAKKAYTASKEFGVLPSAVNQKDFEGPDNFIVMGAEPYRIDLIMGPPGLDFETAYKNRVIDVRGDVKISYVSRDDLITLKQASNRFVDERDVRMLKVGKKIDAKDQKAAKKKSSKKAAPSAKRTTSKKQGSKKSKKKK